MRSRNQGAHRGTQIHMLPGDAVQLLLSGLLERSRDPLHIGIADLR